MTYMTDGIEMDARMQGGLLGGLKRKLLAGESFFLTFFRCQRPSATVAFARPYPGKIIRMPLQNSAILCQRDSFLCAAGNDRHQRRVHQAARRRLLRRGRVHPRAPRRHRRGFIHSGGTIILKELKAGEKLRVDTGCLVAFDPTVDYDIQFVGGIKTAIFGGEGLFFASMTGPGTRVDPDAAVLTARRPDHRGAQGRPRRREARLRWRTRRDRRSDRRRSLSSPSSMSRRLARGAAPEVSPEPEQAYPGPVCIRSDGAA